VHIAHVQGIFSPEHGGPAQSLTNYCQGQVAAGHRVSVWALEGFPHTSPAIRLPPPVEMQVFTVDRPARLGGSSEMRQAMRSSPPADVYHLHGAWLRAMDYAARAALSNKRPYVLEVMGMYEAWALQQKSLQKRVVRWWFQDRILREAACLHVNSHQEADYLRKLGFKRPIAVIPVGVDLLAIEQRKSEIGKQDLLVSGTNFSSQPLAELKERPFILYLSRLHPKKGLDLLIRSWAAHRKSKIGNPQSKDWMLAIAGTGEPEYVKECRELAAHLGIGGECLWLGHVDELQKTWLFTHAHCYVLPTSSENFGNVVPEALAHGTPVITTIHTPWSDLRKFSCGWQVDNTERELGQALEAAKAMDFATRNAMGEAGKQLVHDRYSLQFVLKNIEEVYTWVAGQGPKPECVQI